MGSHKKLQVDAMPPGGKNKQDWQSIPASGLYCCSVPNVTQPCAIFAEYMQFFPDDPPTDACRHVPCELD